MKYHRRACPKERSTCDGFDIKWPPASTATTRARTQDTQGAALMFLLRRPSAQDVESVIAASRDLPLSYDPIGLAKRGGAGSNVDEQTAIVGSGEAAFGRATAALLEWKHVELGWVELFPKRAPIAPGTVVVVAVRHLGFWSLN